MRTYTPKPGDVERRWHVIDATDVVLGRLATQAATLLRGKHKPTFAPHVDTGDFVVDHQRRQGRPDRRQARAEARLPALRLPGRPALDRLHRAAGEEPGAGGREGRPRDAAEEHPRPRPAEQAQGLPRRRAPARRPRSRSRSRSRRSRSKPAACTPSTEPRRTVAEPTAEIRTPVDVETSPRTTHPAATARDTAAPQARRVEHHRARRGHRPPQGGRSPASGSIPGTGSWKINGRTLEDYFPNKVHQQLVNDPFKVTELEGRFDVIARIHGGGIVRPGRRAAPRRRPGR